MPLALLKTPLRFAYAAKCWKMKAGTCSCCGDGTQATIQRPATAIGDTCLSLHRFVRSKIPLVSTASLFCNDDVEPPIVSPDMLPSEMMPPPEMLPSLPFKAPLLDSSMETCKSRGELQAAGKY